MIGVVYNPFTLGTNKMSINGDIIALPDDIHMMSKRIVEAARGFNVYSVGVSAPTPYVNKVRVFVKQIESDKYNENKIEIVRV